MSEDEDKTDHPMNKPWEEEEDLYQWIHSGYYCEIRRSESTGSLCGYVEIPKNHPLFKIYYIDKDFPDFDVHGGITYSGLNKQNRWLIGFDCAHSGDYRPKLTNSIFIDDSSVYRNYEYVKIEVEYLVNQVDKIKTGEKHE